jgi:hypothetical protein
MRACVAAQTRDCLCTTSFTRLLYKGHIRVGDTVIKDPAYLVFDPFSSSFSRRQ